jgi:tetratricopeptide (TPR) repeat protein
MKLFFMMRGRISILLFIITILLTACGGNQYDRKLLAADSLIDTAPDSAVRYLHVIGKSFHNLSEDEQMHYRLLCIKANDKADIGHIHLKDIQDIVNYYERGGDKRLLSVAYYYLGRCYSDNNDASRALSYFQQALYVMPDSSSVKQRSRCYSQISYIFICQSLNDEAIDMLNKALACDIQLKDTAAVINDYLQIGDCYWNFAKLNMAMALYNKALDLANKYGDEDSKSSACDNISQIYFYMGKYDKAKSFLLLALNHAQSGSSALYSNAAKVYAAVGNMDSSLYYDNKVLEVGNVYGKQSAHKRLADHYLNKRDYAQAAAHLKSYELFTDSFQRISATESVERMHSVYNYNKWKDENANLKLKNEHAHVLQITSALIIVVLTFVLLAFTYFYKRKKRIANENYKRIQQLYNNYKSSSSQRIREREDEISALKAKLADNINERNKMNETLEMQIQKLMLDNEKAKIRNKEAELNLSAILDSPIGKRISAIANNNIDGENFLNDNDFLELSIIVNDIFPDFKERLLEICKVSDIEYRVCLLIKIGIRPTKISQLVIRSKESVSSIRRRLSNKAATEHGTPEEWDDIVRSL